MQLYCLQPACVWIEIKQMLIADAIIILGYMRIAAMGFLHKKKMSKEVTLFVKCKVLLGIHFLYCSHDCVSRHLLVSMKVNTLK